MGLKSFFRRWSKGEDRRAIERARLESRMTPHERTVAREDFEERKDDTAAKELLGLDDDKPEADDLDHA